LSARSQAADATFCYQGEVAGVVCNACAGNVKEALLKLEGVKDVKITLNKDGGNPRLTILSNSPALTREAASQGPRQSGRPLRHPQPGKDSVTLTDNAQKFTHANDTQILPSFS
jgi:copper chaperone CopZ